MNLQRIKKTEQPRKIKLEVVRFYLNTSNSLVLLLLNLELNPTFVTFEKSLILLGFSTLAKLIAQSYKPLC